MVRPSFLIYTPPNVGRSIYAALFSDLQLYTRAFLADVMLKCVRNAIVMNSEQNLNQREQGRAHRQAESAKEGLGTRARPRRTARLTR